MKKRTIYQMIVDQSGSMSGTENQVISGFNEQLQAMQSMQDKFPEQEIAISLKFFNENVGNNIKNCLPVKSCAPMVGADYRPHGSTALLDAIGKSIYDIKTQFGHAIGQEGTTVVFIIITDGYENASRMYTYEDIARMIKDLEATENWNFTFMGADLDAISASSRLGIDRNSTFSFDKSDYQRVSREVMGEAMEEYSRKKERGEKTKGFFTMFDKKDIRTKK